MRNVGPPQLLLFYEHTTNSKSERLQIVVHYQHHRRGNRATASDWRRGLRESVSRLARTTSLVNCSDDDHLLVHRIAALFEVFELEQMTAWPNHQIQATSGCALLFILDQLPDAPDLNR